MEELQTDQRDQKEQECQRFRARELETKWKGKPQNHSFMFNILCTAEFITTLQSGLTRAIMSAVSEAIQKNLDHVFIAEERREEGN